MKEATTLQLKQIREAVDRLMFTEAPATIDKWIEAELRRGTTPQILLSAMATYSAEMISRIVTIFNGDAELAATGISKHIVMRCAELREETLPLKGNMQ